MPIQGQAIQAAGSSNRKGIGFSRPWGRERPCARSPGCNRLHAPCRKVPPTVWPSLPSWPGVANLPGAAARRIPSFNMHRATGLSVQPSEKAGAENAGGLFSRMAAAVERTTDRSSLSSRASSSSPSRRGRCCSSTSRPSRTCPTTWRPSPSSSTRRGIPEFVFNGLLKTNSSLYAWLLFVGRLAGTRLAAKLFVARGPGSRRHRVPTLRPVVRRAAADGRCRRSSRGPWCTTGSSRRACSTSRSPFRWRRSCSSR